MSVPQVTIDVTAYSQTMSSWEDPPQVPQITIDGTAVSGASNKPYTASGWQLIVLDSAKDLTTAGAVLSNQFISLQQDGGNWGMWEGMYAMLTTQLLTSGNTGMQIVIVASYGMDANIPPTNDALELLLQYGAGPELQSWLTNPNIDIGSESGDWTGYPANYILIGASALGYGNGTEAVELGTGSPITTTATATFANPGAGLVAVT
jgi:hypothetical protein